MKRNIIIFFLSFFLFFGSVFATVSDVNFPSASLSSDGTLTVSGFDFDASYTSTGSTSFYLAVYKGVSPTIDSTPQIWSYTSFDHTLTDLFDTQASCDVVSDIATCDVSAWLSAQPDGQYWVALHVTDMSADERYVFDFQKIDGLFYSNYDIIGITPQYPNGQTGIPYRLSLTGRYGLADGDYQNRLVFSLENQTTSQITKYELFVDPVLAVDNNLPYTIPLVLSPSTSYEYSGKLCYFDGTALIDCQYETQTFSFTTGTSAGGSPVEGGQVCDDLLTDFSGCLQNALSWILGQVSDVFQSALSQLWGLFQQSFPFNLFFQFRDAINAGLNDETTSYSLSDVSVNVLGGDLTVFTMDGVEGLINGEVEEEEPTVLDFFRTLIGLALWLAFILMVWDTLVPLFQRKDV